MNRLTRSSLVVAFAAVSSVACKKEVDPSRFDAGGAATPAAPTLAPAATDTAAAAPTATDSVAPLASLSPGSPTSPRTTAVAARPAGSAAKKTEPKKNLPECDEARKYCGHPAAATDKAMQNLCTTKKQACFAKGGVL